MYCQIFFDYAQNPGNNLSKSNICIHFRRRNASNLVASDRNSTWAVWSRLHRSNGGDSSLCRVFLHVEKEAATGEGMAKRTNGQWIHGIRRVRLLLGSRTHDLGHNDGDGDPLGRILQGHDYQRKSGNRICAYFKYILKERKYILKYILKERKVPLLVPRLSGNLNNIYSG